jgi:hypothetical protein
MFNDRAELKLSLAIFGFGAIGGIAAWFYGHHDGSVLTFSQAGLGDLLSFFAYLLFGGMASMVFVIIMANTDRTDRVRLVALSLLAGFVWQPVLSAGRTFVNTQAQVTAADDANRRLGLVAMQLESLSQVSADQRGHIIRESIGELTASAEQIRTLDSLALRTPLEARFETISSELAGVAERSMASSVPATRRTISSYTVGMDRTLIVPEFTLEGLQTEPDDDEGSD